MVLQLMMKTNHMDLYKDHSAAYKGDSGIDLFFPNNVVVKANETLLVDLEISCELKEINNTFKSADQQFFVNRSFYLYPRSSIYKTPLRLANSVGIIDSGYRGNIKVAIDNTSDKDYEIKRGTKLFQLCSSNLCEMKLILTDTLSTTSRGEGGFGSSGC